MFFRWRVKWFIILLVFSSNFGWVFIIAPRYTAYVHDSPVRDYYDKNDGASSRIGAEWNLKGIFWNFLHENVGNTSGYTPVFFVLKYVKELKSYETSNFNFWNSVRNSPYLLYMIKYNIKYNWCNAHWTQCLCKTKLMLPEFFEVSLRFFLCEWSLIKHLILKYMIYAFVVHTTWIMQRYYLYRSFFFYL